jgi:hypothetical protein
MPTENDRTVYAVWDGDIIRYNNDDLYREVARLQAERIELYSDNGELLGRAPINIFVDEQPLQSITVNFTIESKNIEEDVEFENSDELDRFLNEFAKKEVC